MGGGSKGGSADQSGMMQAMVAAQEADKMYQLGEQQLQWSEQVWNQQEPTVIAAANAQMALEGQQAASMQQATQEAAQQWGTYQQNYLPEELKLIGQVNDWASPGNQALVRGQAMGDIAEQGQAGVNTAAETLREYGVNPSAPKYASLYTEAQPMLGAAQAAAGTTASQNLKLQQLGLESGVVNTGRGLVNATGALTTAGTQAGAAGASAASGAGSTLDSSLTAGSNANANSTQFFNAGTNAMNSYVNAVNGYNQAQVGFADANASEMSGLGSAAGGILGLAAMKWAAKGGPITKFDDGGSVDVGPTVTYPSGQSAPVMMNRQAAPQPMPSQQMRANNASSGSALLPSIYSRAGGRAIINDPRQSPQADPRTFQKPNYADGGVAMAAGGVSPGVTPAVPGVSGIPSWGGNTGLPSDATPGGGVPAHASPSMGVATDDVPAMLTAHEFVIPKDVATWKGHEFYAKHIDQARKAQQAFANRDDIGGETAPGIPQSPTFVSRPDHAGGATGGWETALGQGQSNPGGWPPQGGFPTG
jgi:hypothetical protein